MASPEWGIVLAKTVPTYFFLLRVQSPDSFKQKQLYGFNIGNLEKLHITCITSGLGYSDILLFPLGTGSHPTGRI